jgi:hypothetical protein
MKRIPSAVTIPRSEYVVLWDGSHGDADGDLLDERNRVPVKIEPVSQVREINLRALVRATLAAAPGPMLMIDIAHALETSTLKINSALYAMKNNGEIETTDTGQRRPWGQTVLLYALSETARESLKIKKADFAPARRSRASA